MGYSLFCRGSSASILIMPTILVIGTIMIFSVSDENMIEPIVIITHVKIVVKKEPFASEITLFLILSLAKA